MLVQALLRKCLPWPNHECDVCLGQWSPADRSAVHIPFPTAAAWLWCAMTEGDRFHMSWALCDTYLLYGIPMVEGALSV